jgi:hypothetical protein
MEKEREEPAFLGGGTSSLGMFGVTCGWSGFVEGLVRCRSGEVIAKGVPKREEE